MLPAAPLSPQASTATGIGDSVLIWDYELTAGSPESALVDELVVAWYCDQGALYKIQSGTWESIPPPDGDIFGRPTSAGSVVLFAGAAHEGHANALWAYKP